MARASNNPTPSKFREHPGSGQRPQQPSPLFQQGLALHQQGKLADAMQIYTTLLASSPNHFDALHLSGLIEFQFNNYQNAVDLIAKAIALHPHNAHFFSNRGNALLALGQMDAALASYDAAIHLQSDFAEAYFHRGIAQQALHKHGSAVDSYDRAISFKPDYAQAYTNRGNALQQLHRLDEAVASYDQAINLLPDYAEAYYNRGNAQLEAGQPEAALDSHEKAIRLWPDFVAAYCGLGDALQELRQFDLAVAIYDKAISIQPDCVDAYYNRGMAQQELRQPEAALASYEKAISIRSDFAAAYYNRGNVLLQLKQLEYSVASYDMAIRLQPGNAQAYYNRGNAQLELKQPTAALASYDLAISIQPGYAEAYSNRGLALQQLQQVDAALASYEKAISLRPDYAEAYSNLGIALQEVKQLEAALLSYETAIRIQPDYAEAYYNRGNALHEMKQLDASVASYDTAISLKPDYSIAYWNKALALLCKGDYAQGWDYFEWRWKTNVLAQHQRHFLQALWTGSQSLKGKTILLHAEQGLGDTLQFCRYAPLVAALGARVVLEVQAPLVELLRSLPGDIILQPRGTALPEFDFHCPLMSLPLAFKTTLESVPLAAAYLRADAKKSADWRQRLATYGPKKRVGLVWNGGFRAHQPEVWNINERRNISFDLMAQLNSPKWLFVSLQKGHPAEEELLARKATVWPSDNLLNFADALRDFSDTAALIDNLDLVISVDTSTAHLAAALGKPVWLLNRYDTCWRWLLEGERSAWYESVRIYRQPQFFDWDSVLLQVQRDLQNMSA